MPKAVKQKRVITQCVRKVSQGEGLNRTRTGISNLVMGERDVQKDNIEVGLETASKKEHVTVHIEKD